MFSLKMNNIKSDTLKHICLAIVRNKKAIPYFLTLNDEPTWPYHRFHIEVDSNPKPLAFPLYFDPPICETINEASIFDDILREKVDIAIK